MFRFAFGSQARVACLGCAVAIMCFADVASARAAWPLASDGDVLLGYGAGYTRDGRQTTHTGLDLAAEPEAPILSPVTGQVSFAGRVPAAEGTMLAVTIRTDDDLLVTLMPLSATALTVGRAVSVGDALGPLAGNGDVSSGASHLHVGVRRAERYLDPLSVLGPPPAAAIADPTAEDAGIEPNPVQAEPPVSDALPAQAGSNAAVRPEEQVVEAGVQLSFAEVPGVALQGRSAGDVNFGKASGAMNPAPVTPSERVRAIEPDATGMDSLPRGLQPFRDAHVGSIGSTAETTNPPENAIAGAALLGAGLLALWPLWRGKRHPVPDVRPEINDVAAAVSR